MWATTKRPQDFASVIGQSDAIQVLENSKGHTTFILHGSSGVGKTTLARIFANEMDSEIIEIDGASNNGVDNIRSLIDAAMYIPVFTKYKAFIIDEAHMLTTQAWNALLKILEEAPKTTIWIICTTEFAKIPTTIKSRSISIRLKNIDNKTLKQYLIDLAEAEGYLEVDSEVLDMIVSRSEGRVREAITSLETFLTTNTLNYNFSMKDIIKLVSNMFSGDLKACNDAFALLTNDDVYAIIGFLKDYIKFLMFVSVEGVKAEVALTQYTNIHAKYLQDLRALQQVIWSTCPYDGEPWHATIRHIYDVYNILTQHYNDFRDGRQAFEMATLRIIAKVKGNE